MFLLAAEKKDADYLEVCFGLSFVLQLERVVRWPAERPNGFRLLERQANFGGLLRTLRSHYAIIVFKLIKVSRF